MWHGCWPILHTVFLKVDYAHALRRHKLCFPFFPCFGSKLLKSKTAQIKQAKQTQFWMRSDCIFAEGRGHIQAHQFPAWWRAMQDALSKLYCLPNTDLAVFSVQKHKRKLAVFVNHIQFGNLLLNKQDNFEEVKQLSKRKKWGSHVHVRMNVCVCMSYIHT